MADLFMSWGALASYNTNLDDGTSTSVDTGGVEVTVGFDAQDGGAQAFTFGQTGYTGPGEPFSTNSYLKLRDITNEDGAPATSTTTLDFSSTDPLFSDQVQNVSFRINDIDGLPTGGDADSAGTGWQDIVTIRAFDANGDPVDVTLTPGGGMSVTGDTATGDGDTEYTSESGSLLVDIAGPVQRVEIVYENGGGAQQVALVSDVHFSTVDSQGEGVIARDDTATTDEDVAVVIDVLGNDEDLDGPDGDLVVTTATATNGAVTINPDGTLTYTPNADYNGPDAIEYTIRDADGNEDDAVVTLTVDPLNDPPVAVDDDVTTDEGEPIVIPVLANDTDPDGDPLTVTGLGSVTASNGSVAINGDGTITYTPDAGFVGTDTFEYTVEDPSGESSVALVTVTVEEDAEPRIDTDVFPVAPGEQPLDPLDGLDEDPDPDDDRESIDGTSGADVINGGDDADTINGGGGDDTIEGGIDDDLIRGGGGDDLITDVQGADTVLGGMGNDTIIAGTNTFSDYVGDDPRFDDGAFLRETFGFESDPNTGDGRDSVQGNRGNDFILTGDDADTIDGGGENDTIDGGLDDDSIMGGQGDDSLIGSHGSDTIDGGQGNDFIDGSALNAIESIGGIRMELTDDIDPNPDNDRDFLFGALGDDTILGGDDDDTLIGGSGNDSLDGGIDDDSLRGGDDDDTLIGGQGNDTLNGGAGMDAIDGGADRDVIVVDTETDMYVDATTFETVDGGAAGDDFDRLDLSAIGERDVDWRLVNTVTDSDGNGLDGTVEFLGGDGEVTGRFDFVNIEEVVPCFTPGTLIATPQGERLVEDLEVGDRVITRDNGIQEIAWVGRKDLTGHALARSPHMNPVLIRRGALGKGLPERDTLVSPNHRVLVANDRTALYFEEREVLVAAKHLTGLDGVDVVEARGVSYIHVMFARHEVILSNGAWTESFQPGDHSLKGMGDAQRDEILALFPELAKVDGLDGYGSARRSLKRHEAMLLTQ